jgi:phenylacetate-CoA ligase
MTKPVAPEWAFLSAVPGSAWPAIPTPEAAMVLAVLQQLEQSQWLDGAQLLARQVRQLEPLLRHAHESVPWYRERWAGKFDPDDTLSYDAIRRLPLLTRRDIQDGFTRMRSDRFPPHHGQVEERTTSGSTGAPVRFLGTGLDAVFWNAFTLRDHSWHRRDLSSKLAVIRRETTASRHDNWGPATQGVVATGPAVSESVQSDVATLFDWLRAERPGYLLSYPSLIRDLAKHGLERGLALDGLLEVRSIAESVGEDVRDLCRSAWGASVTDVYSASEVGYLALQCPDQPGYHVQSEGVLLEVLDDRGEPCTPGEVGRVVVTGLRNFAMPLVRYDIGDYAEVGDPCPCGRGLPVLRRILGRVRNTLVTADGQRFWPTFGKRALAAVAPIRQYQFVQKSFDLVEARLVVATTLTGEQEDYVRRSIQAQLPDGVHLAITYRERLERGASGKFEDFVSEVAG